MTALMTRRQFAAGAAALAMPLSGFCAASDIPAKWDETFDVVIVGSGFAGTSAAAAACQAGARTVVFEKMRTAGGNSIINGGGYACWTDKLHLREKFKMGEDSEERHANDTLKGGDFYNDPALVKVLAHDAPAAMDWMLTEGGLELAPGIGRVGGHSAYRDHYGTGAKYIAALTKIAKKYGFKDMRLRSKVVRIYRKPAGAVVGVQVETRKGLKNVRALRGVVLAAGGFSRDVAFRMALNPTLTSAYASTNQPGATAETLQLARDIGADAIHLAFIQLFPTANPDNGGIDQAALIPIRGPGFGAMYVSNKGERFVSELQRRDVVSQAEVKTGGKQTWCVFSREIMDKAHLVTPELLKKYLESGRIKTGKTPEELARAMGVPEAAFAKAIADHNAALAAGKDTAFGKPIAPAMLPMKEGPYYAVAQWPSVHHTQGGVRINAKAQVLDIRGKVIPGLYAAGEFTGGVHGNNRLGGNGTADGVVFGRIAGAEAAARK